MRAVVVVLLLLCACHAHAEQHVEKCKFDTHYRLVQRSAASGVDCIVNREGSPVACTPNLNPEQIQLAAELEISAKVPACVCERSG